MEDVPMSDWREVLLKFAVALATAAFLAGVLGPIIALWFHLG